MKSNNDKTKNILYDFTESYIKKTETLKAIKFGFKVDEKFYIVNIQEDKSFEIRKTNNEEVIFSFVTDINTLNKIHTGKMTALTAMGRSFWSDKTPLNFINPELMPKNINPFQFVFRYFSLGQPEKIKLEKEYARIIHGAYAIPLLYDEGLRTGWYRVEKGMIINENEKEQTNPFPTLIIGIKGKGYARIGDKELVLKDGVTYYIDKNISHSFWTEAEEGLEFIIIMYGKGA